ncbi:MBL fold metallo-hydrolase [Candidatus Methylospira mobilis]|uniref:MBL fold metallo-hydrolase n=1 Tax=Candidatus Methylospira mobilis TaxID=1808979 RepID=A0A5Q0BQ92_9GAMM|nr:MBL fold metallo-hydrolase [Candidatus Methylospira mobilis]QFY43876.1 MBL fold metallo-hydrolase [Candidatus Methylospira mobilis]WNV04878.1 MBL fold metallo-hydrolase [Candidatus Methylospira mobilis]
MRNIQLFNENGHRFVLLNESEPGEEEGVRSNQYLVMHDGAGVLFDPGGFGVMPRVLAELLRYLRPEQIRGIVLSHQDPDIVGGLSTWMEVTQCPIYVSNIWMRFLPHYGLKDMGRFIGVPDTGMKLEVTRGFDLQIIPAHFLHSEGQINAYDPLSGILFSGDIGAAMLPLDKDEAFVDDFKAHLPFVSGFHRRYMCSNKAIRLWLENISGLDISMIASQHGPVYRGAAVSDFLEWLAVLECGIDILQAGGVFAEPRT